MEGLQEKVLSAGSGGGRAPSPVKWVGSTWMSEEWEGVVGWGMGEGKGGGGSFQENLSREAPLGCPLPTYHARTSVRARVQAPKPKPTILFLHGSSFGGQFLHGFQGGPKTATLKFGGKSDLEEAVRGFGEAVRPSSRRFGGKIHSP